MKKFHERSLRLNTNDENRNFETLFQNNKNQRPKKSANSNDLSLYKIVKNEAPAIMKNLFFFQENIQKIRNFQIMANESKYTVRYGL